MEQYREKKFLPVYKEKLEALKNGILNETSCENAISVAKEYILNSLEKDYTCSQDLSKAKASDFQRCGVMGQAAPAFALEFPRPGVSMGWRGVVNDQIKLS